MRMTSAELEIKYKLLRVKHKTEEILMRMGRKSITIVDTKVDAQFKTILDNLYDLEEEL